MFREMKIVTTLWGFVDDVRTLQQSDEKIKDLADQAAAVTEAMRPLAPGD